MEFTVFARTQHMQSVPKILKAHGFATACIGKKHVEPVSVYPFDYEPDVNSRSPVDVADKVEEFLSQNTDTPVLSTYRLFISHIVREKDLEMIDSMRVLNPGFIQS